MNFSDCTASEILEKSRQEFIREATESMQARFSRFVVTPEQTEAWKIGFSWIYEIAEGIAGFNSKWRFLPEFSAPLISGRPDLAIDTGTHLVVVEMKTGFKASKNSGERQVLAYADDLWGKIKIGRNRIVVPVLVKKTSKSSLRRATEVLANQIPSEVLHLSVIDLIVLLQRINDEYPESKHFNGSNADLIKYSPRPSVVEAATSLVAALDDKNVTTGLASSEEVERLIQEISDQIIVACEQNEHRVIVISGSPGSGKTLIGLRIAHDRKIQELLSEEMGTPLYLTGNAPLVEVLTESLARDEVRRLGSTKKKSHSNASAKVRLIHGITEKNVGIESNIVVFDEGQRVWTETHMRFKKKNEKVGSEAEEVLTYLERLPWAIAVVLLGEGQEINTGEAGLTTWLEAIVNRNLTNKVSWKLSGPRIPLEFLQQREVFSQSSHLHLQSNERTDNAANISQWTEFFLNGEFERAKNIRLTFGDFPMFFTRDLETARKWLHKAGIEQSQSTGLIASSKSKRLVNYGVDPVADANRSFNWANWYLNSLPDLNSSAALEIAATEYKCQGLELDWVGLCWSWDLIPIERKWQARTLDSARAKWKLTSKKSMFQINAYRVLLTRARKGMVVWIPEGDTSDPSRSIMEMNSVAEAFSRAGIEELKIES
jgi:hypothetical protein